MYCPNCGNKTSAGHRFCRSCGLGLEKIAQSLVEQLPTKLDENLRERKNKIERLGVAALSIFGVGVLSLILYGVCWVILVEGKVLEGVGLLAFFVIVACGLLSVYLFAKADEVKEAEAKRPAEQPEELAEKDASAKLLAEGSLEPIPSVTERTTELLFAEKKGGIKGS